MFTLRRFTVTVDRLYHHAARQPLGIWLPFLACVTVIGLASIGPLIGAMRGGLRTLSGTDAQDGGLLGTHMLLGAKDPKLNGARAAMLRREYRQCRIAEQGLRRAVANRDAHAVLLWKTRAMTVRSSYALIAAQSTDQVFATTGLPRRF